MLEELHVQNKVKKSNFENILIVKTNKKNNKYQYILNNNSFGYK